MHFLAIFFPLVSSLADQSRSQAALNARSILASTTLGELATIMSISTTNINQFPYCSVQYVVEDCEEKGVPLLALVGWGTHSRNLDRNSNSSIFVRDLYWYHHDDDSGVLNDGSELDSSRIDSPRVKTRMDRNRLKLDRMDRYRLQQLNTLDRGLMDHARFTLFGTLYPSQNQSSSKACLQSKLKDSRWLQGHEFKTFNMEIKAINYVGGFGDEHYVGWLDMDEYRMKN